MPIEYEFVDDEDSNEKIEEKSNEMVDINIWEFNLNDEEIDDMIEGLRELKENKAHFHFDLDEENELVIHHEDEVSKDDFEVEE